MGSYTTNQFLYKPALGASGTAEKTNYDAGLDLVDKRLGKVIYITDPKYNADPTGATDIASALQQAIDDACVGSAGGIGRVYIPGGKYKLTQTVYMKKWVSIIGAGPQNTIFDFCPAAAAPAFQQYEAFVDGSNSICGFDLLNGFSLIMNSGYVKATPLILFPYQTMHIKISNMLLKGDATAANNQVEGIKFDAPPNGGYELAIENIRFWACKSPIGALSINGGASHMGTGFITRCGFYNCFVDLYLESCENFNVLSNSFNPPGVSGGVIDANGYFSGKYPRVIIKDGSLNNIANNYFDGAATSLCIMYSTNSYAPSNIPLIIGSTNLGLGGWQQIFGYTHGVEKTTITRVTDTQVTYTGGALAMDYSTYFIKDTWMYAKWADGTSKNAKVVSCSYSAGTTTLTVDTGIFTTAPTYLYPENWVCGKPVIFSMGDYQPKQYNVIDVKRIGYTPYAASYTPDCRYSGNFTMTLTGNTTINAPVNPIKGLTINFIFTQDATGARTVSWNSIFRTTWSNTGNSAGKKSAISFIFDGTDWVQLNYLVWA